MDDDPNPPVGSDGYLALRSRAPLALDVIRIRAFAGDPVDQARYYPEDTEYLLTRPSTVLHYESSDL
jgi:hypothetical protein